MKKWLIGSMITVLIGSVPSGTYAANHISGQSINSNQMIQQSYQARDNRDRDERERKTRPDDDWERRERERKERERKEQERRKQEERERERKEQEQKERERREREQRELERREKEQRELEWREWSRRNNKINDRLARERWEREQRERENSDARYTIRRTASIITLAQRNARINFVGLALVVAHQQRATDLYRAGFYREAIFHSLRARRLAITIITKNKVVWRDPVVDTREESYYRVAPRDNDIDLRIDRSRMAKDNEAVKIIINIDIN